jgi:hypothetical protein
MNVWILGCGPDAIFAAHAAVGFGHDVSILAHEKRAAFIAGSDHLTHNVPGLCKESFPGSIEYRRMGEGGSYGEKVYGTTALRGMWPAATGVHPLYSLRNAYTQGWMLYHELINVVPFDVQTIRNITKSDLVINTLSAKELCVNKKHKFPEREMWRKSMPTHGQTNRIIYSSAKEIDWYCWALIENICTWEFSKAPKGLDRVGHLSHLIVPGPKGTDCDCQPEVLRIGRLGRWEDLVRPHEAYTDVHRFFSRLIHGAIA